MQPFFVQLSREMLVFSDHIPDKPLTNMELSTYARELEIPQGCFYERYTATVSVQHREGYRKF